MAFGEIIKHAWNTLKKTYDKNSPINLGTGYSVRPDRVRFSGGNEQSIINSIYNRIALDVASVEIKHIKIDDNGRFLKEINSSLNSCFNLEANLDQTGRAFVQDIVMSMFDEGVVAVVPIDTDIDPDEGSFKIETLRVCKILEWYPRHIKVRAYNDETGVYEDIVVTKKSTAIIENPFYSVMNERNSTMQRLVHKLKLLDVVDEQSSSGKLDLIIQLPYVIKTEARRIEAEKRMKMIEDQLSNTKYGVAYSDATEKIVQLNRPIENNLMKQIEYLVNMAYSQIGINQSILDGTANEETMLNYNNRIIEVIVSSLTNEFTRKFLTKTARSQYQTISYFIDPFRLISVNDISEIADKFTRNEILTSNEIRQIIGMRPSSDPNADVLRNKNLSLPTEKETSQIQNGKQTIEGVNNETRKV